MRMWLRSMAVLLLSLALAAPATAVDKAQSVTLHYRDGQSTRERISFGSGVNAREFYISLLAERDTRGAVSQLTVELTCIACRDGAVNAMYGGRNWHGMQPFMFSTALPSGLGGRRDIALPQIGYRAVIDRQMFRLCTGRGRARQICEASVPITFVER